MCQVKRVVCGQTARICLSSTFVADFIISVTPTHYSVRRHVVRGVVFVADVPGKGIGHRAYWILIAFVIKRTPDMVHTLATLAEKLVPM